APGAPAARASASARAAPGGRRRGHRGMGEGVSGVLSPRRGGARALASLGLAVGLALGLAVLLAPAGPASANPNEGEARPIAGEGDGASTVTNPANLGFLRGVNGILDFALMAPDRRRRGSGVGAFVGLPLPLRLAAVGLGYQLLLPWQPESAVSDNAPAGNGV